jgi:tRNA threonylcarbamoyl adenosine modification protein YeaZ
LLNLAFDTATGWGRFALARDDRLLAYMPVNVTGSYADALLPMIEHLFAQAGCRLADLDAIGVTRGPGSFTGVRIGVATAKGLAYGLNVPLVAVTTLEAMAAAMLADQPDRNWAVPALDARRREVFAAVYRRRGPWVELIAPPQALSANLWWAQLLEVLPDPETPVWGGSGAALLLGQGAEIRPELRARGRPVSRCWSSLHAATAKALALAMGDTAVPLGRVHPFALTPLYLRPSDAEVKRGLDLTPRAPGEVHDQTGQSSGGAA